MKRSALRICLLLSIAFATRGADGPEAALTVYPEAVPVGAASEARLAVSLNPRVPCVPPVPGGGTGRCLAADAAFTYRLAPWLQFPEGGQLHGAVRDNLLRRAKQLFVLFDDDSALSLDVGPAASGRQPALVLARTGQAPTVVPFDFRFAAQWTPVELRWDRQQATLAVDGRDVAQLALATPFAPTAIRFQTFSVDDLTLAGAGRFALDWETGYAARITPAPDADAVRARLFGFDALVVSQTPTARDFPMFQILAAGPAERTVTIDFAISSEVRERQAQWRQSVTVAGNRTTMVPVEFPFPLSTDVYHLTAQTHGLSAEWNMTRHFMHVQRRVEPAGPPKFGLHGGGGPLFGGWPDALPIGFYHSYANWGYIQGPVWTKDVDGQYGLDPSVPPAEWNWDPHIEWALAQGLEPYLCINAAPLLPWMCDKVYAPKGMPGPWPSASPKEDLYRRFVRALGERYRGKVRRFEVQNEPNAYPPGGYPPGDYVRICKAFYEEMHAANPDAVVYGICGTSRFVPWMTQVFEAGGAIWMDHISFHTYTTPTLPDRAGLAQRLAEVRELATQYGKPLRFFNSETGTYVALREVVDRPVSDARLTELIEQGAPAYCVPAGWPSYALPERVGSLSAVRNATINLLAGADCFTFFRWSPDFPPADWWTKGGGSCFAAISCAQDGQRTPSRYTLALGVLTAQLEGALNDSGTTVEQPGIGGGIFAKANGGQVAVLWSAAGTRTILLRTADPAPDAVDMLGRAQALQRLQEDGPYTYRVELGEDPAYVHVKTRDLVVVPSPVTGLRLVSRTGNTYRYAFALANRYGQRWQGRIELSAPAGWQLDPAALDFELAANSRRELNLTCTVPAETDRGAAVVNASMNLPDGMAFTFPIDVALRPACMVARVPENMTPTAMPEWEMPGGSLRLDRPEQVVVGRPPLLAALQEEKYWKGSDELSGRAKVGYSSRALYVYVQAHDANLRLPAKWPGVGGSCVELFFDFRPLAAGLGQGPYGQGVYQVILRPSLAADQPVEIWHASKPHGVLDDVSAAGGPLPGSGYWVAVAIPWASAGVTPTPGYVFNLDVGIDGARPGEAGRKSQIMLFGTADNCLNASNFGAATLATPE